MKHKKINPVVPTLMVFRHADGAACCINAEDFDPAMYREQPPAIPRVMALPAPHGKRAADLQLKRAVYGKHF